MLLCLTKIPGCSNKEMNGQYVCRKKGRKGCYAEKIKRRKRGIGKQAGQEGSKKGASN